MAKRKNQEDSGGGNEWMNTYADMVTLLFAFFVMLFSMSSVETEKWEMLVKAFSRHGEETSQVVLTPDGDGDQIGANQSEEPYVSDGENPPTDPTSLPESFDELYEYMKNYVESNDLQESVSVEKSAGSVTVSFQNNIFFMPDSAILSGQARELIQFMQDGLVNVNSQILAIKVSGHTAKIKEIPDYPISDWTLSTDRANSVVKFMTEYDSTIGSEKFVSQGFGYNHPVATNDTPEGRERNRRVDVLILSNNIDFSNPEEMQSIISSVYDTQLDFTEETATQ